MMRQWQFARQKTTHTLDGTEKTHPRYLQKRDSLGRLTRMLWHFSFFCPSLSPSLGDDLRLAGRAELFLEIDRVARMTDQR